MNEKKPYRLYAMTVGQAQMEEAAKRRFHRLTPGYILVYDQEEGPEQAVEIDREQLCRLTEMDKAWLMDCARILISHALEQRQEERALRLEELVAKLETEWQVEAAKGRRKEGAGCED